MLSERKWFAVILLMTTLLAAGISASTYAAQRISEKQFPAGFDFIAGHVLSQTAKQLVIETPNTRIAFSLTQQTPVFLKTAATGSPLYTNHPTFPLGTTTFEAGSPIIVFFDPKEPFTAGYLVPESNKNEAP